MRAFRAVWWSLMAVMLIAGMANGLRIYYLVFMVMLLMVLCCFAMSLWTYLSFSYLQHVDKNTVVRGDEMHLTVGIFNDKFFPFTRMRVRIQGVDVKLDKVLSIELPPKQDVQFDIPLELPYRGEFSVGMTELWVCDCFGLLPIRFDLRKLPYYRLIPVTVLPALTRLPAAHPVTSDAAAFARGGVSDEGESFAMVRSYRPGDKLRSVHWKLSARRREVLVRRYDIPEERTCLIVPDARPIKGMTQDAALRYADAVVSCALALADQALLAGHPVRIADGRGVLAIHSTRQFEEMRTALAHLRFDSEIPPEAVLDACAREGNAGLLYVVSGQCGQGLVEPMRSLSFGSCALVHIGTEVPEGFMLPCYAVKDEKQLQAAMGGAA